MHVKRTLVIGSVIIVHILCISSMGMADGFGLGPTIGFPTGLEALWWITPRIGLEAGAGVSLDWVQVYHADLMITVLRVTDKDTGVGKIVPRLVDAGPFFVSFGLGPRAVVTDKETEWSIRSPALFSFYPGSSRWELFYQFAWCVVVYPELTLDADIYLGARFYFARRSFQRTEK